MSVLTPHFCTNNCKPPIRAARPQDPIHPYLHEVNVKPIDSTLRAGADRFDKYYSCTVAESETDTPSPSAVVAENSQFTSESDNPARLAADAAFAAFQAATDAWIADPTPANKSVMIGANMRWHDAEYKARDGGVS